MSTIKVTVDTTTSEVNLFCFSGGEAQVRLAEDTVELLKNNNNTIVVTAFLTDPMGFMGLLFCVHAIRELDKENHIDVVLPYIPYGRQDRVCVEGEANTFNITQKLLTALPVSRIVTYDVHNEDAVLPYEQIEYMEQADIFKSTFLDLKSKIDEEKIVVVSPDKGAAKKIGQITSSYVQCDKVRDPYTGKLTGFKVTENESLIKNKDCIIIDDICDGGGTFIGTAQLLKSLGAKTVSLYVTHGIFSKGVEVLLDNGLDKIYTTNSICKLPTRSYTLGKKLIVKEIF